MPDNLDALKTLYESRRADRQFLAERQFTSTIQSITINLLIVGGLIASDFELTMVAKKLGTFLIVTFNIAVVVYLRAKKRSYNRIKFELPHVEAELLAHCPCLNNRLSSSPSNNHETSTEILSRIYKIQPKLVNIWRSSSKCVRDGTNIFCTLIIIACICSVSALWVELKTKTTDADSELNRETVQKTQPSANNSIP